MTLNSGVFCCHFRLLASNPFSNKSIPNEVNLDIFFGKVENLPVSLIFTVNQCFPRGSLEWVVHIWIGFWMAKESKFFWSWLDLFTLVGFRLFQDLNEIRSRLYEIAAFPHPPSSSFTSASLSNKVPRFRSGPSYAGLYSSVLTSLSFTLIFALHSQHIGAIS